MIKRYKETKPEPINKSNVPLGYELTKEWRSYDISYLQRSLRANGDNAVDPRLKNCTTGNFDYPLKKSINIFLF